MKQVKYIFLLIILIFCFVVLIAKAFESTSTNFEIHAGDIESIVGTATSSNFQNRSAGGQDATGFSTSTSKRTYSGILYWLFSRFTTNYNQVHYRWRNDDGSETSATWAANEDTSLLNLSKNTIKRLRFEISNEGWTRGGGVQFKIQYAQTSTCSNGSYVDIPTSTSLDWQIADSPNLTDGSSTTNISGMTPDNAFFVAGQVKDTGNLTSAITITSEDFTEIEYSLLATNNAINGGSYCFRLVKGDGSLLDTYNVYAQATVSGAPQVSCTLSSTSTSFAVLAPSSVSTSSPDITLTISATSTSGVSISVNDTGNNTNPGLYKSTSPTYLIQSQDATLSAGTDGYGIQVATTTAGTGATLSLSSKYNKTGNAVGGLTTTTIQLASSTADLTNREIIIKHKAAISFGVPVGSYSDTITYTCSAQ